jgi:hypothetical protein
MMKRLILALTCVVGLAATQHANAIEYTGSLTYSGGGLVASDGWAAGGTELSWTVEDVGSSGGFVLWQYSYTFTVPTKDISHFIIEVSADSIQTDFSAGTLDWYDKESQGKSNPDMPGGMYGLKFDFNETLSATATFTTTRAPVWGDFYAKDGKADSVWVTAWNAGFLTDDPTADPCDGSIDNHILRPDTRQSGGVPDGGASAALLGIGMLGLGFLARRKA